MVLLYCKAVKDSTLKGVLAGSYYGYRHVSNQRPGIFQSIGHAGLAKVADSDYLDFIALPYSYMARPSYRPYASFSTPGTLRVRNKLFIIEADQRTSAIYPSVYSQPSVDESVAVMQRDWAHSLCSGNGLWFKAFDAGRISFLTKYWESVRWFGNSMFLDSMYDARSAYKTQHDLGCDKNAEIAVIVDYNSVLATDIYASIPHYNSCVRTLEVEIPEIGAPYDVYNIEDLDFDYVRDNYKMYVFLNSHRLVASQVSKIVSDYQTGGKTLVWLWAPGAIHATAVSANNMRAVTGIPSLTGTTAWMSNPAQIKTLISSLTAGFTDGFFKLLNWHTNGNAINLYSNKMNLSPVFWIDPNEPNSVIGGEWDKPGHEADGRPALALKDNGDWKSVFCGLPFIPSEILRNIATDAGVHIYCEEPGITYQGNSDFAVLYNTNDNEKTVTVTLPDGRVVYDAISGLVLFGGASVDSFDLDIDAHGTRVLQFKVAGGSGLRFILR